MTVSEENGALRINSDVIRCNAASSVALINAQEAYAASHGPGAYTSSGLTDFVITGAQLVTYEIRGKYVPAYQFTGEATWPDGHREAICTLVDAVQR